MRCGRDRETLIHIEVGQDETLLKFQPFSIVKTIDGCHVDDTRLKLLPRLLSLLTLEHLEVDLHLGIYIWF